MLVEVPSSLQLPCMMLTELSTAEQCAARYVHGIRHANPEPLSPSQPPQSPLIPFSFGSATVIDSTPDNGLI